MSVFFVKGKGWRYEFILKGQRYSKAWFATKSEAKRASIQRREEIQKPIPAEETLTDISFLDLVNRRLDYVKVYHSASYYKDYRLMAKKWTELWTEANCRDICVDMIQSYILTRGKISAYAANYDLRCLRSLFNFGIKRGWILNNPTSSISFLPVEKKVKYIPSKEDVLKVIVAANPDTQDYLWTIKESMGRMSEINRLTWDDVNFDERYVVLFTRKKKGGHLTPRKIPMTRRLYSVPSYRYSQRDTTKPWVFWHTYTSSKSGEKHEGPYQDRKKVMRGLCQKADVKYFRFHALRHAGASIIERRNVPIGPIQRILGHEKRTTTEIYLHSIGEAEKKLLNPV